VLRGETRGYTNHPQLERFKAHPQPRFAINSYLAAIHNEAAERGYSFDSSKIGSVRSVQLIPVNDGQLLFEWRHLQHKLADRSPAALARWSEVTFPECHRLFRIRSGPAASWERAVTFPSADTPVSRTSWQDLPRRFACARADLPRPKSFRS
jgi:hypothetical protein